MTLVMPDPNVASSEDAASGGVQLADSLHDPRSEIADGLFSIAALTMAMIAKRERKPPMRISGMDAR